jgi:hypothetical protein
MKPKKLNKNKISEIKKCVEYDSLTGKFKRIKLSKNDRTGKLGYIDVKKNVNGYFDIWVCGKIYRQNRLAWCLYYNKDTNLQIDHINGDRTDNRICNLREVTNGENIQNQIKPSKNNTSGFLGVCKLNNKFGTRIRKDGIDYYLGCFNTPEEASKVYIQTKKKLHISSTQY